MRFAFLQHRISGELVVIIAIGIVSMLSVSVDFFDLHRTIHELLDVKEPIASGSLGTGLRAP